MSIEDHRTLQQDSNRETSTPLTCTRQERNSTMSTTTLRSGVQRTVLKEYPPNTFTIVRRGPVGEDLLPYIQAFTALVLSTSFLLWRSRTWQMRFGDLNACLACLTLHHWKQPLLSLSLAIGYTVYTNTPGTFSSLNLPSYTHFKRKLPILASDGQACGICYEHDRDLAKLPCAHKFCIRCLDLMASNIQTACPYCRRALFSVYDKVVYVLFNVSAACQAVVATLSLFLGLCEILRAEKWGILLYVTTFCMYSAISCWTAREMWRLGDSWWRGENVNGSTAFDMKSAGFACCSGIWVIGQFIWGSNDLFV